MKKRWVDAKDAAFAQHYGIKGIKAKGNRLTQEQAFNVCRAIDKSEGRAKLLPLRHDLIFMWGADGMVKYEEYLLRTGKK